MRRFPGPRGVFHAAACAWDAKICISCLVNTSRVQ